MAKKNIKDLNLKGKKVLMRVDFNVPMKGGVITDDNRIVQALPTIRYALEQGGKVILFSHLGRIKTEEDLAKNSLALVAKRLEELLGKHVEFVPVTRGKVLEDASNQGIASHFPNDSAAGFLLEKEIKFIGGAVDNPVRPFVASLGGAKVSDKISVIENLLNKADKVMICGAMAYTFFKAQGLEVGKSKCELDFVEYAKGLLKKANGKIILPVDVVSVQVSDEDVAADFFGAIAKADTKVVDVNHIDKDAQGLDCGPKTIELFKKELVGAKTVVWNGPAGVFEVEKFAKGTKAICEALANLDGATTIIGGGDSAAAAISMGYETKFTHISTGGGASLEYLEGKALPGVTCLSDVK